MTKFIGLFFVLTMSLDLWAWGRIGHRVVGGVADKQLSKKAKSKLVGLIGRADLSAVANWADDIKSDEHWDHAYSWHYATVEDGKTYKESEKNVKGDIVEALMRFCQVLKNTAAEKVKREEALKFMAHLVGDLHQPLHIGRGEDKGGNTIKLTWFGESTNLHAIWDDKLIEQEKLSFSEYVNFLNTTLTVESNWKNGSVEDWANENIKMRETIYQTNADSKFWEYKYFYKNKQFLNQQLYKAGVRLAGLIESCLN